MRVLCALLVLAAGARAELIDHHQHLFSPDAGANSSAGAKGIRAADLIRYLDEAGIRRAVVLSVAYTFSNPNKPPFDDEYARVRRENDWTSAQVAQYPDRLTAFCSVNPLKAYALKEIARCAKDARLKTGLKLHFGNSDVDIGKPDDLAKLKQVFRAANRNRMAIVVHMRTSVTRNRPYGAQYARLFIEQLLPEARDVPVQVAHLGGAGGYTDPAVDEAVQVFIEHIQKGDRRVRNLWFDVSVLGPGTGLEGAELLVRRMRQIGLRRLLYASDAPVAPNLPVDVYRIWRQLPLTAEEFRMVETNVAPYLRTQRRGRISAGSFASATCRGCRARTPSEY